MTRDELLRLFRLEVDDRAEPYFWSDEEFDIYLEDAQDVFVRAIRGIADRRSPLTKFQYKSGDQFKKYDERILRIKGAFDEQNRILTVRNLDNLVSTQDDYGQRALVGLDDGTTGDIQILITDVEANEIQLYPIPNHDGFVRMFVYRRPLSSELEIPSQHHLSLLSWVKYRAFSKHDVETFDEMKAAEFRTVFAEGVADARREKSGREDTKRLMAYGGI